MVIFCACLYLYLASGYQWKWFLILLFLIDVSMVGYLVNNKIGAYLYNLGHSFILPVLLTGLGYMTDNSLALSFGLIWMAHIGLDRAMGFGLKFTTGFADTHLGRIGRKRNHVN